MELSWHFVALASFAFVAAGFIKGTAGMGLPTTAIAVMPLMIEPRLAIAILMLPMLVTNGWQVLSMGDVRGACWRYRWFLVSSAVVVWIVTLASADVSDRVLAATAGGVIVLFAVMNLTLQIPPLPPRFDTAAQVLCGTIAGVLGGLTSLWAAPIFVYLLSRQVDKDETIRASGLLIFVASVPLSIGYVQIGHLTWPVALFSALMILPALLGFALGEVLRNRLSPERFRTIVLFVFLGLGLNLLRRALF